MYKKSSNNKQSGMVSITVTIVFIAVISLVVLGFSQVSRRNSRETLDRQLSSQAFYAAETGVRDVQNKIAGYVERGEEVPSQTDCKGEEYTKDNGKVGADEGLSYTCLLVNPNPADLSYDNISSGGSIIVPLNSTSGPLTSNEFEWRRTSAKVNGGISNCPVPSSRINSAQGEPWTKFLGSSAWTSKKCPFAVVRIELMPVDDTTLNNPVVATQKTMVVFAYPQSGNGDTSPTSVGYDSASSTTGMVIPARCDNDVCKIKIDGLNFGNAYARIRMLYSDTSNLRIKANDFDVSNSYDAAVGDSEHSGFSRAQVVIDATGKSQDVLRRIQVRGSLIGGTTRTDRNSFSDYAFQSRDSICKRFEAGPSYVTTPTIPGLPTCNAEN